MISLPSGQYAWLLLGLLPGVWLLAARMLQPLDRPHRSLLTPVLASVMLILATHIASLATHSIYCGFPIAAYVLGIAGYATLLPRFSRKRADVNQPLQRLAVSSGQRHGSSFSLLRYFRGRVGVGAGRRWLHETPSLGPPPEYRGRETESERVNAIALPVSFWVILIVTSIFICRPIFAYSFYESATVPGHEATPSAMLNGYYPPVYLAEPTIELRYHYGFDVMVAITQMMLRVRVDQANDLVTLGCWMMLIGALWVVGETLIGREAGSWCAMIVPFAGGLTFFGELAQRRTIWTGPFRVGGVPMLFPFSLNFFQKPWAIGLPVWCLAVVLIVHCARSNRRQWSMLCALALTVCGLALLEAVLFASLVAACGICLLPRFFRKRELRVLETGLAIVLGAALATQLHGFFAVAAIMGSDPFMSTSRASSEIKGTVPFIWSIGSGGIAGGWGRSLLWNLLSFCLLLPLGIAGLRFVKSMGILAVTAVIALITFNLFRYPVTNDINKFASLAAIPLSVGVAAILHRWWNQSRQMLHKAGLILLGSVVLLQGWMFVASHWIGRGLEIRQPIHPFYSRSYPIDPDDAAAISWLRGRVRPPENVYCRREEGFALKYARWGGLPVIWSQDWDLAFGMSKAIQVQRIALAEQSDRISLLPQPQLRAAAGGEFLSQLKTQGVAWVIVHDADDWLLPALNDLKSQGKAETLGVFGKIQIYRIF
jgi:hypothetical protein